jgi:hypothetical protein
MRYWEGSAVCATWTMARFPVDVAGVSKNKVDGSTEIHTSGFQDLTRSLSAIRKGQRNNLVVSGRFDLGGS